MRATAVSLYRTLQALKQMLEDEKLALYEFGFDLHSGLRDVARLVAAERRERNAAESKLNRQLTSLWKQNMAAAERAQDSAALSAVRRQRLLQLLKAARLLKKERAAFCSQARKDTNEAALMFDRLGGGVSALLQQRHTEQLNYALLLQQQRDSLLHLQHARAGELAAQAEAQRLRRERELLSEKQSELLGLYSYHQGRARMLEEKYDECQRERLQLAAECRQLRRRESDRQRETRDWQSQTCKREEDEEEEQDGREQPEAQSRARRSGESSSRAQTAEETGVRVAAYLQSSTLSSSPNRSYARAEHDAPQQAVKRARISLQPSPSSLPHQPGHQRRPPSFYTMLSTPPFASWV